MRIRLFLAATLVLLLTSTGVPARDRVVLAGPVIAEVQQVVDGDTIRVVARVWPGVRMDTLVRLDGINTPELRAACAGEKALARRARAFVIDQIGTAPVRLRSIRLGKYAGRVLAQVETGQGVDLVQALLRAGLGRPYTGGRRAGWCAGSK